MYFTSISKKQKKKHEFRFFASIRDVKTLVFDFLTFNERNYVNKNWMEINRPCDFAASEGFLDLLQWARSNDCEWDAYVCAEAASHGHLEVLKWARSKVCDWNAHVCAHAALNGHLKVLQWARSQGCEWDSRVCSRATSNGHLKVLQWARSNDCDCA